MNRTSHSLQTLKFDISFSSEGQAIDLHKKISRLSNEKVHAIIAKVFDEELQDERVFVKIDHLEIDLGEISYTELDHLLPERVYRFLKESLRQQLFLSNSSYALPQSAALKRSEEQYNADTLYFFLQKGILPWWATGGATLQLEQLFVHLLKTKRQEVLAVIYADGNFLNIVQRIVYQFSDSLLTAMTHALSSVYAKQLIDYSTDITRYAGALKPIAYTHRQYKWIMLLTFLNPNDQRAGDVMKSMVKFFLGSLAAENNLTAPGLIDHFQNEFTSQAPVDDVGRHLKSITMALLNESVKNTGIKTPGEVVARPNFGSEKVTIEHEETIANNEKIQDGEIPKTSEEKMIGDKTTPDGKKMTTSDVPKATAAEDAAVNDKETLASRGQIEAGGSRPDLLFGKASAAHNLAEKDVQNPQTAANTPGDIATGDRTPAIATDEQVNAGEQQTGLLLDKASVTDGLTEKEVQNQTGNNPTDVTAEDTATGSTTELQPVGAELWQLKQHNRELYQYLTKFIGGYNDAWTIRFGLATKAPMPGSIDPVQPPADKAVTGRQPTEGMVPNRIAMDEDPDSGHGVALPPDVKAKETLHQKQAQEIANGTSAGEGPPLIVEDLQLLIHQLVQLKKYDSELYGHIVDFTLKYNQKWKLNKDVRVYARDLFDHIVARYSPAGRALEVLEATLLKMGYRAGKRNQAHPRFREEFNQGKIDVYYIENAGLVLFGPILATYYERLFLMKNNEFISKPAQDKAAHMLQFLVDGTENNSEDVLLLNKILCGMDITAPVEKEVTINASDKETAFSLLNAVRENWPALKNSSVDTFRVEFLLRSGKLNFYNGEWVLRVEHDGRSDYLLDSLPWSFRMIKNSWMPEIMNVEWT